MSELVQVSLSGHVHVRACVEDGGDLAAADVLYFAQPTTPSVVAAQLKIFPGCVVCAGTTEGGVLLLAVRGDRRGADAASVASALHALLAWRAEAG